MCRSKSKTFLVSLVLLVLALSQVMAWPSLKKTETPMIEPVQQEIEQKQELPQEPQVVKEPSPELGLTESDKEYLTTLSSELKTSLEDSTKETIRVSVKDLELLLAKLDEMQSGKAVMDASHAELSIEYSKLNDEYNSLAEAYSKAKRGKLMLGTGASFDIDSLTLGAGLETGYIGNNYYTTLGVDKGIYSFKDGILGWDKGYELSVKLGLLF